MQSPLTTPAPAHLRVILQGEPKSGKTILACQFPGAYIIDVDVNIEGPIRRIKDLGLKLPLGYDHLDKDESGKDVPINLRYQRFLKLFKEAYENPAVETIVIDSATTFASVLDAEVRRLQPAIKDERQFFGFFFNYGKTFMDELRKARKHIILICHEKIEKDAAGSVILPFRIAWPGQLGTILPAFFTDVWRCETLEIPKGAQKEYKWVVKTMPNFAYKLGNSLGLPAEFEFKWEVVAAKLNGAKA